MSDEKRSDKGDQSAKPEDIDNSPTELPLKAEDHEQVSYADLLTRFNEVTTENAETKRKNEELVSRVAELERTVQTNAILDSLIVPMADKIFWFMCSYCGFVAVILLGRSKYELLPETTVDFLVGSTAVTVIGLVGTIVAGIFSGARRSHN